MVRREGDDLRVLFAGAPIGPPDDSSWTLERKFAFTCGNIGNILIGQSLFEELKISSYSYWAGSSDPFGHGLLAERVDEDFDIIVIPASNFIFKAFDLSRFADLIESTKLPCVVAGLGAQAPHSGEKVVDIPDGSKRFLKVISERSKVIGVRGDFTAEVMNDFGITNVRPIGCPSLYRKLTRNLRIKRPSTEAPIRVSINGSRDVIVHTRSPEAARQVEAALIRLSIQKGYSYVLQTEIPEMRVASGAELQEEHVAWLNWIIEDLGVPLPVLEYINHIRMHYKVMFDLSDWDEYIRGFDLSIGSRFHGNLIALTNGVPAIILNHDSRTTEMAELMGIPHVFIDDIAGVDPAGMLELADFDRFEERYRLLYDRFADFLEENGLEHRLADAHCVEDAQAAMKPIGCIKIGE